MSHPLPTFTLAIEMDNLDKVSLDQFFQMLKRLESQTLSLDTADRVLLMNTEDISPQQLERLCKAFPWLEVINCGASLVYDAIKVRAAEHCESEVLVYADCDCIYEPQWLEEILRPFADPEVLVVVGECSTEITGPFTLALSMTRVFPRFSNETELGTARSYLFNNVAFRREALARVPFITDLPSERALCFIHAVEMRRQGITLVRNPRARSLHPNVKTVGQFFYGHFKRGLDTVCTASHFADPSGASYRSDSRWGKLVDRARQAMDEDPSRKWMMPLALPIVGFTLAIYAAGYAWGKLFIAPQVARSSGTSPQ
ncbi:MAG: glycosyltransferase [Pseudomonadota bacterium]